MNPGRICLLAILLIAAVLISGCTQAQSNAGTGTGATQNETGTGSDIETSTDSGMETGSGTSANVAILGSSCTPTQRTDEYGDVTNLNQLVFSGWAMGAAGSRLEVFLIAGGGVPGNNALLCLNWEKVSGVNACISDGSDATWSFYWEDYFPSTTEYGIRARVSGVDQTATAVC